VMCIYIRKQKIVWILKLKKAAASVLRVQGLESLGELPQIQLIIPLVSFCSLPTSVAGTPHSLILIRVPFFFYPNNDSLSFLV
jgi:hypothetical protein